MSELHKLRTALSSLQVTVLPSSICPGFGVYALKRIQHGTILGEYPGRLITDKADELLRDCIRAWRKDKSESDKVRIDRLKVHFNVDILPITPITRRGTPSKPCPKNAKVDWEQVYKTISAYSFQTDAGTIVPAEISYSGYPLYDPERHVYADDFDSLTPFINEPPPMKFLNMLTGKIQKPLYNVDVYIDEEKVIFYAKRNIMPGQELFLFYGPTYRRDYNINLRPNHCGWGRDDWDDADSEEQEQTELFLREQQNYKLYMAPLPRPSKARREEMKATCQFLIKTAVV